jgi:hypothetical protein
MVITALGLVVVVVLYMSNEPQQANAAAHGHAQMAAHGSSPAAHKVWQGGIEGHVTDAEGQPVPGVILFATNAPGKTGLISRCYSDSKGRFRFDRLAPGTYRVHGEKTDAGFLPLTSGFHSAGGPPPLEVTVGENEVVQNVTVQLGPKGAMLIAKIIDATTKHGIKDAHVTLRRADNPYMAYSTSVNLIKRKGVFKTAVPAVPITVEVSATGYEPTQIGPLNFNADNKEQITIPLRPIPAP